MRILFCSLSYVPSRRASAVQVTRMCSALARAGHDVTLLAKRGREPTPLSDHAFYGVPETFSIVKLPRPKWRGGGALFAGAMGIELARRAIAKSIDLVFARDLPGARVAAAMGHPVVFEAHGIPDAPWLRSLFRSVVRDRRLRGLVAISHALRADLASQDLLPTHAPVVVAHDAADPPPARVHRPRTGGPRIGYIGSLYPGRGIELVVEVARREPSWTVDIIGGNASDLAEWQARGVPSNAVLHGFVPPGQLAARYADLDVVLMPYARTGVGVGGGRSDTNRWCSPMKMFEYMGSGVPIVASDLPVLGEVLAHGRNALIAPAGDVDAWRTAIHELLDEPDLARRLATTAHADLLRDHTWDRRVETILAAIAP